MSPLWSLVARRLLLMIPTLFGITLVTFVVLQLAPGDPFGGAPGDPGGAEAFEARRAAQGLDQPLPQQYAQWVRRVVTLDFGRSWQDGRPVRERITEALPRTLLLSALAMLCAWLVAVPLGAWAAVRHGTARERAVMIGLFLLHALPAFWVALMLLLYLAGGRGLSLFPLQGLSSPDEVAQGWSVGRRALDVAWHLVLPVAVLSYGALAWLTRYTKTALLEVIRQDFVRTARAKGLPEGRVIVRHALRNGLLPLITVFGLMLPQLLGGSVIVERVFGIPGMGLLVFEAILHRDHPVVLGVTTLAALITLAAMLVADLLYALVDPRVTDEVPR